MEDYPRIIELILSDRHSFVDVIIKYKDVYIIKYNQKYRCLVSINCLLSWNLNSIVGKERIKKIKHYLLINGNKYYGRRKPWKKREYWGGFNVFKEDDPERPYLESGIWIQMRSWWRSQAYTSAEKNNTGGGNSNP